MSRATLWLFAALAASAAAAAAGCGSGAAVYPVKGKVTFEGKPLVGGGSIAFVPLTPQPGRTAGGIIDEAGNFVMTTNKEGDGSPAGEFRVVVTQQTEQEPTATKDGEAVAKSRSVAPADRIPAAFADHMNSPAKTKVEPKANELIIDLKRSDVPPPARPAGAMGPRFGPAVPAG